MLKITLFCLLLGWSAVAAFKEPLKMWIDDREVAVSIQSLQYKGGTYHVNQACAQAPKNCEALKILDKTPPAKIPHPKGLAGHPASHLCENMGGKDVILTDEKKEQYNFCLFKDKSLIDSWQVHAHHFKKGGQK